MKYSESKLGGISFDEAIQMISQVDRIIIKLYQYGMAPGDIAFIVNNTEKMVNYKISRIKQNMEEIMGDDAPITPLRVRD